MSNINCTRTPNTKCQNKIKMLILDPHQHQCIGFVIKLVLLCFPPGISVVQQLAAIN